MGVSTKAIIIEDVLDEVFSYLPEVSFDGGNFPIVFDSGDEVALNGFLANREKSDTYPLLWMLYPQIEDHLKTRVIVDNLSFILAVTTNNSMENRERIKTTFKEILMPVFYNIRLALQRASVVTVKGGALSFKIIKHPNYSSTEARDSTGAVAIWDALKITVSLEIIEGCIKPIKI